MPEEKQRKRRIRVEKLDEWIEILKSTEKVNRDSEYFKQNAIKENDMSELKPCPRCGTKAYLSRDVVDGFYFGWSAGCPRYCHYDGIHGTTIDTSEEDCYAVHGANSKEEAIEIWNNRVEHLKELDQQKGCKKIFEEMQKNQLR